MGFAEFMNNPKAYLGHHRALIQDAPASANACIGGAAVVLGNGRRRMQYTQHAANYISMIHVVGHGQRIHSTKWQSFKAGLPLTNRINRTFNPIASAADVGFRYLPFRENHCTYTTLDAAATFFITGPLTGCTIATLRHGGAVWVFHSNDNMNAGAAARLVQRGSIQEVCNHHALPYANVEFCEYGTEYDGFGFVFGRRRGGGVWKFYAHATDANDRTRTRKWAEV